MKLSRKLMPSWGTTSASSIKSETPLTRPVRAHRQICQTLCRAYCPSLAHHLSLFAAHAFTLATGSHASVAGWDRPTCVPCRQSFLVCLLWLCLALVRRLECLRCLKMQMVYSVCTSTSSRPESRLRLHKCNIWAALRASPMVLRRYHASPRSGPDTPALVAGGLDHLSAAAWVSPPCLMRVLRLPPPCKLQTTS